MTDSADAAASPRTPLEYPAVILAGGRSSRMGSNKALRTFGGQPLIAHILARLAPQTSSIAINAAPGWAEPFGCPVISDTLPDQPGPLAGVLAGLRYARNHHPGASHMLSAPADSPFFPSDLARQLTESLLRSPDMDGIAIAVSDHRAHPVFGLWPVAIADDLEAWLKRGENRKVRAFLARHPVREVEFAMIDTSLGPLDPFFNINTPDDLSRAERFLEALYN